MTLGNLTPEEVRSILIAVGLFYLLAVAIVTPIWCWVYFVGIPMYNNWRANRVD